MRFPDCTVLGCLALAMSARVRACTAPCSHMTIELYPERDGCSDDHKLLASSRVPTSGKCAHLKPMGDTVRTLGVSVEYLCDTQTYAVGVYVDKSCGADQVVDITDYKAGECENVMLTALGPVSIRGEADEHTCAHDRAEVAVADTNDDEDKTAHEAQMKHTDRVNEEASDAQDRYSIAEAADSLNQVAYDQWVAAEEHIDIAQLDDKYVETPSTDKSASEDDEALFDKGALESMMKLSDRIDEDMFDAEYENTVETGHSGDEGNAEASADKAAKEAMMKLSDRIDEDIFDAEYENRVEIDDNSGSEDQNEGGSDKTAQEAMMKLTDRIDEDEFDALYENRVEVGGNDTTSGVSIAALAMKMKFADRINEDEYDARYEDRFGSASSMEQCAMLEAQLWFAVKDEEYDGGCNEDSIVDEYVFPTDGTCTFVTKPGEIPLVWISAEVDETLRVDLGIYTNDDCTRRMAKFTNLDVSDSPGKCTADAKEQVSIRSVECSSNTGRRRSEL